MDIDIALKHLDSIADSGEIFFQKGISTSLDIKGTRPDLFMENAFKGYGVRVLVGKKEGFVYANQLTKGLLEEAVRGARASDEDPYCGFPEPTSYHVVKGCYDEDVEHLDPDSISDKIQELTAPCHDIGGKPTTGGISWSVSRTEIANTKGLFGEDLSTYISCHLSAVAREDPTQSGFFYDSSRTLNMDFAKVGEAAARLAVDSLKACPIESQTASVTFRPHAVSELLEGTLLPAFSADNVQRSRSILADRIGERIFSESLQIDDVGNLEGGLMSSPMDGEGTPTQKTSLIEDGVLKGYIYDTYTATKGEVRTTGNADRGGYSAPPSIHPSNVTIKAKGDISGAGLVVNGLIGAHTSNPVTGDFSLEARNAFINGKPVKKAILAGNVYEILERITGFGTDVIQVSSIITPSIEVEGVRITG